MASEAQNFRWQHAGKLKKQTGAPPQPFEGDFLEVLGPTGQNLSHGRTGQGCWHILRGGFWEAPSTWCHTLDLKQIVPAPLSLTFPSYKMSGLHQLMAKGLAGQGFPCPRAGSSRTGHACQGVCGSLGPSPTVLPPPHPATEPVTLPTSQRSSFFKE